MNKRLIFLGTLLLFSSALHAQDADGYFELPKGYGFQEEKTQSKNDLATANIILKVPTADLIAKFCATYPRLILSDVPTAYSGKITIKQPSKTTGVLDNKVLVQGTNAYQTPLFINNKGVRLGENGQYYTECNVDGFGKVPLFMVFTTPDKHFFVVKRDVISLATPKDIDQFVLNRKFLISFFNSDFLYNPNLNRRLTDQITRADLAYFLTKIHPQTSGLKPVSKFQDVPDSSWFSSSVSYVTSQRLMSEFPDGQFYPEKQVTRLEYVMTILRALQLPFDNSNEELPYRDVKPGHWSTKFIRTALKEKLIAQDVNFNGEEGLTLASFASLIQGIDSVERQVSNFEKIERSVLVSSQNIEEYLYPIMLSLNNSKSDYISKNTLPSSVVTENKIVFLTPKPYEVTLNTVIEFTGKVLPAKSFMIGNFTVVPSADGQFSFVTSINIGETVFATSGLEKNQNFKIIALSGYNDLDAHWSKLMSAKLKALRILEDESSFYPNKVVTRGEFVLWLSRALQWPLEPVELSRIPSDLDKNSPHYLIYLKAIQLGVLSLDDRGHFKPNAVLNKSEAVTALMQAIPLNLFPVAYTGRFPFYDVPTGHWARTSVAQALKAGLIAPSKAFFPKKELTRAEFVFLLSRMPSVQNQLNLAFELEKKE